MTSGAGSEAVKGPQAGQRLCQSRAHCSPNDAVEGELVRQFVALDHARRELVEQPEVVRKQFEEPAPHPERGFSVRIVEVNVRQGFESAAKGKGGTRNQNCSRQPPAWATDLAVPSQRLEALMRSI